MRVEDTQLLVQQQRAKHLLFKGLSFGFVGFFALKVCMLRMDAAFSGCFWGYYAF